MCSSARYTIINRVTIGMAPADAARAISLMAGDAGAFATLLTVEVARRPGRSIWRGYATFSRPSNGPVNQGSCRDAR